MTMIDSVDSAGAAANDAGSRANDADTVKISAKHEITFFIHGDTPDFSDVLDAINPLQQIPIIGTIYREITGEEISPASRIAGGALYGGPIGAALGAITSAIEYAIGEDPGKAAIAWVTGDDGKHSTTSMLAASDPVEMPAGEAAPIIAVEIERPQLASASIGGATAPVQSVQVTSLASPNGAPAASQGKPAAATQLASATMIPPARLRNRTGGFQSPVMVASATPATKLASPVLAQAQPQAAPAAVQVAQAPTPTPTSQAQTNQPQATPAKAPGRAMTIAEAAAADQGGHFGGFGGAVPGTFGGVASTAVPQSAAPVQLQGQPALNGYAAHSIPAPTAAETNRAAAALSQVSATGISRTGLPTAGAVTPAMVMVEAKNAADAQDSAAQQFVNPAAVASGNTTLRAPRINNTAPKMPVAQTMLPANHTAVDLPAMRKPVKAEVPAIGAAAGGGSAGGSSSNGGFYSNGAPGAAAAPIGPVATQSAATQSTAAAEESVVVAPATPPANLQEQMQKALDKYDALVKSRNGAGVNASY